MLMPLFVLLFLDNDLQEQLSDEVSVDINHMNYDATKPPWALRAINDVQVSNYKTTKSVRASSNGDINDAREPPRASTTR